MNAKLYWQFPEQYMCKMYNVYIMYRQCVWQRDMSDTREKQIVPTPGEHCLCPPICHTSISSLPSTSNNHAAKNIFQVGLNTALEQPLILRDFFSIPTVLQFSHRDVSYPCFSDVFFLQASEKLAGHILVEECCRTRDCGINEYLCNKCL